LTGALTPFGAHAGKNPCVFNGEFWLIMGFPNFYSSESGNIKVLQPLKLGFLFFCLRPGFAPSHKKLEPPLYHDFPFFRKKKGDYPGLDLSDKAPISQALAKHEKTGKEGVPFFRKYPNLGRSP
jgi:hypothetical protein